MIYSFISINVHCSIDCAGKCVLASELSISVHSEIDICWYSCNHNVEPIVFLSSLNLGAGVVVCFPGLSSKSVFLKVKEGTGGDEK